METVFLDAIRRDPNDRLTWMALADWLEEDGQVARAELVRLHQELRQSVRRPWMVVRQQKERRIAELLRAGTRPVVAECINSLGMRFARIPAGRFLMGSTTTEKQRYRSEGPRHEVALSNPWWLAITHVTQAQYVALMLENPSAFREKGERGNLVGSESTDLFPVDSVTWFDAVAFCERLSALPAEVLAGRRYRLPTEAEWEYASRGAMPSRAPFQTGLGLSGFDANFLGTHPYGGAEPGPELERPCPVAKYPPNVLGLYDMHGNMHQWCADWLDEGYYGESPGVDPPGPASGTHRVLRGGTWCYHARACRCAFRDGLRPDQRTNFIGFRVAMDSTEG